MQVGTMDGELGPLVAGVAAARLLEDELAEAVVEAQLARLHRHRGELFLQPEFGQLSHAVRQEIDADAERLDVGRSLEDPAWNAGLAERERERQSAHAAA